MKGAFDPNLSIVARSTTPRGLVRRERHTVEYARDVFVDRTPDGIRLSINMDSGVIGRSGDSDIFTPDEARHLANLLIRAADMPAPALHHDDEPVGRGLPRYRQGGCSCF